MLYFLERCPFLIYRVKGKISSTYPLQNRTSTPNTKPPITHMKATEQFFPVVLFIMLYKAVLAFESVGEILKCDHSNESY